MSDVNIEKERLVDALSQVYEALGVTRVEMSNNSGLSESLIHKFSARSGGIPGAINFSKFVKAFEVESERQGGAGAEYILILKQCWLRNQAKEAGALDVLSFNEDQGLTAGQKERYLEHHGVRCPFCGHDDVHGTSGCEIDCGVATQQVMCPACERDWTDVYKLIDVKE